MAGAMGNPLVGLGSIQFWGFNPAIDLQDGPHEPPLNGVYDRLTEVSDSDQERDVFSVLGVGMADIRHILKTIARFRQHKAKRIDFFVVEKEPEVLARHLLLLAIVYETDGRLGLRGLTEKFLEVFGNACVTERTAEYIAKKGRELRALISDNTGPLADVVDFSLLKMKERDALEDVFASWDTKVDFDVRRMRDDRLRQHLGTRYDHRRNIADYDFHMSLINSAPIVNFRHFRTWRETGVAFEFRDCVYNAPNRSMAAVTEGRLKGKSVVARGFWCDVANSPYASFGVEANEAALFKKRNDMHVKSETDVSEYNVMSLLHELETGQPYKWEETKETELREAVQLSDRIRHETGKGIKDEESLAARGVHEEGKEVAEDDEVEDFGAGGDEDVRAVPKNHFRVRLVMGDNLDHFIRKSKTYEGRFNCVNVSIRHLQHIKSSLRPILAPGCTMVCETTRFLVELKKEHHTNFSTKVQELARAAGFDVKTTSDFQRFSQVYFESMSEEDFTKEQKRQDALQASAGAKKDESISEMIDSAQHDSAVSAMEELTVAENKENSEVSNANPAPEAAKKGGCDTCAEGAAKYTCPACSRKSCGLECVRAHKEAFSCSGMTKAAADRAEKDKAYQQMIAAEEEKKSAAVEVLNSEPAEQDEEDDKPAKGRAFNSLFRPQFAI